MSRPIEPHGWALVTGAASGIGEAIARQLHRDGFRLLLADRNALPGDLSAHERVRTCRMDLADVAQVDALATQAEALDGGCAVLVNCAGIHPKKDGRYVATGDISLPDWEQVLRINLTAPFLLCQRLLPAMRERGWGRVVNISSRAGRTYTGAAGLHYTASKSALIGMTRQLAGESAAHGVTVNCVAPGRVETPLLRQAHPDIIAAAVRNMPGKRMGTAQEIAAVVGFLVSDAASFVTGACVDANGGDFTG